MQQLEKSDFATHHQKNIPEDALGRIKRGVDKTLQKEQAGLRPNDSTTEQILIIKKVTSQSR